MNVYTILARLLPTVAVDRAVRVITKAVAALAAAEQAQNQRATALRQQARELNLAATAADEGAARAGRIARRLSDLTA
jgi:prefoldin subunit 5